METTVKNNPKIIDLFLELAHVYFLKNFNQLNVKGLHPGQLGMLKLLSLEGGLSQREIAKRLHIKPPTVAVTIKRMEKNQLLKRETDPLDQRITRVSLTDSGLELRKNIEGVLQQNEIDLFQGFSEAEICLLKRFFEQMIGNIKKTMPQDPESIPFMHMCSKSKS